MKPEKLISLISHWVVRFALNAGIPLDASAQANYRTLWLEGFSDIAPSRLQAAFVACLRSHPYKTIPTVGDIRSHLQEAECNAAEEGAARKWDEVRSEIRRHYSPDIPWHGRKIGERTKLAIAAAGGMAYLAECIGDDLVFARKRFIESYLRWDELKRDEYLLPDGELKKLLSEAAEKVSVTHLLEGA